jgi:SAM-dependent MidA family methyltransferase
VLLFVANEFLDALPAKQFVGHHGVWHERWIVWRDGALAFERGPRANDAPAIAAREGDIAETSPAMREAVFSVARHIADHDGLALFIDYGHAERGIGDTMQAVKRHAYANPLEAPGGQDLTIHVDFEAMSVPAVAADAYVHGPVTQAAFLNALGARERTAQLARAKPEKAEDLMLAYERLTGRLAMGELFKVMALTGPGGPVPAGMGA